MNLNAAIILFSSAYHQQVVRGEDPVIFFLIICWLTLHKGKEGQKCSDGIPTQPQIFSLLAPSILSLGIEFAHSYTFSCLLTEKDSC